MPANLDLFGRIDLMVSILFKMALLFLFWILLSGSFEPSYVIPGLISALVITLINADPKKTSVRSSLRRAAGTIYYAGWLVLRIWASAFHVAKLAFHPALPISPRFFSHTTTLETDTEKVIFANSITLTPGTVTASLEGQELVIHQLDETAAGDIVSGAFETAIARIRGRNKGIR